MNTVPLPHSHRLVCRQSTGEIRLAYPIGEHCELQTCRRVVPNEIAGQARANNRIVPRGVGVDLVGSHTKLFKDYGLVRVFLRGLVVADPFVVVHRKATVPRS